MERVSATEARNNFSELLNRAAYGRERILIEKRGKPLAYLSGLEESEGTKRAEVSRDAEEKLRAVDRLAGGISLGKLSKKLTPSYLNKILDERYEDLLSWL